MAVDDPEEDSCLQEDPFVWAVQTSKLDLYCSFCLKKQTKHRRLQRCSQCKCLHYCDAKCQTTDWPDHQIECKRLQALEIRMKSSKFKEKEIRKLSPEYPDDSLRMISRLIGKLIKDEWKGFSSNGRSFDDLMTHANHIATIPKHKQDFKDFCMLYGDFCGRSKRKVHEIALLSAYSRAKINGFGISDDHLQSVGVGLYLSLSRMDHSCEPTARIVFLGKRAKVVPTRRRRLDAPLDLASLTHSYIDSLQPLEARRKELANEYYFYCECNGCSDLKRNETMLAFACQRLQCVGQAIERVIDEGKPQERRAYVCNLCSRELTIDEESTAKMAEHLSRSMLEALPNKAVTAERKLDMCVKTVTVMEGVLHRYNLARMRTYRGAYEACVALQQWSGAVEYGYKVLEIYRHYQGEYDPWLVVFIGNLAAACLNAGDKATAMDLIFSIVKKYELIFGKGSEPLEHISALLRRTDEE